MSMFKRYSKGSILVLSLVAVFVAATLTGALCSYYVNVSNISEEYVKLDTKRFVAGSVKEQILAEISQILVNNANKSADEVVGLGGGGSYNIKALADSLRNNLLKSTTITANDMEFDVALEYSGIDNIEQNLLKTGKEMLTVLETVTLNGSVVGVYQVEIEFYTIKSEIETTLPIFDYVYFASKYGHLYPSSNVKLVVNGDVHSNGKFDIYNTTINGFISASNEISVTSSKIWPYWTYQTKVKDRYNKDLTQVRPTNPTRTNENVTAGIEWVGGYEPVYDIVSDFDEPQPTNVVDGTMPTKPEKPTEPTKPTLSLPDEPTYPTHNSGDYAYDEEPKQGEGKYAYPSTEKPEKGKGKYAYPDKPYSSWFFATYWYYNGKYYGTGNSAKEKAYADYDKDCAAKDAEWKTAYDAWQAARDAKDEQWKADYATWVQDCADKDAACDQKAAEMKTEWQNECTRVQNEYNAAMEKYKNIDYPKYQDDMDQYKADLAQYELDVKAYEAQHAAYLQYKDDLAAWEQRKAAAAKKAEDWNNQKKDGTLEIEINETLTTICTNNVIVTNSVGISRPDITPTDANIKKYQDYCKNYVVSSNQTGGTLTCLNLEEDDSSIVLTNVCEKHTTYRGMGGVYGGQTLAEERKFPRKLAQVRIYNGYLKGSGYYGYPFEYESGSIFESLKEVEAGSVVLIGTKKNPIEVNGPVFINGDVLIRGIVRGRGSIYASRNIHIVGDLIYEKPPTWPATYMTDKSKGPDAVAAANKECDLLALVAMKSIVVGDYTSTNWQSTANMKYLTDYDKADNGRKAMISFTDSGWSSTWTMRGTHLLDDAVTESDLKKKYPILYEQFGWEYLVMFSENIVSANVSIDSTRKYYESTLGNYIVSSFQPSTPPRSLRDKYLGIDDSETGEVYVDAKNVTQIDAVLFANNGIIGEVGGENKHQFTLNGAMICTDECLFPSFNSRFENAGGDTPTIWLNWDLRIRSDAKGGLRIGMEEDFRTSNSSVQVKARVTSFQQVQ